LSGHHFDRNDNARGGGGGFVSSSVHSWIGR
jgi:hypothetical protein